MPDKKERVGPTIEKAKKLKQQQISEGIKPTLNFSNTGGPSSQIGQTGEGSVVVNNNQSQMDMFMKKKAINKTLKRAIGSDRVRQVFSEASRRASKSVLGMASRLNVLSMFLSPKSASASAGVIDPVTGRNRYTDEQVYIPQ